MNSMTGFGKAERKTKQGSFTVEVSSVNNRFLDITVRMPRHFSQLETPIRDLIGSMLRRGKVNVFIGFEEPANSTGKFRINEEALESYYKQLRQAGKRLSIPLDIPMSALLILPEVSNPPRNGQDMDTIWAGLEKISHKALSELLMMRRREGAAMARQMKKGLTLILSALKTIGKESAGCVDRRRQRLQTRIEELVKGLPVEQSRLEEEIAIFAERTDISEECTRLKSHVQMYSSALSAKDAVGKRLNFILQEMNREANTIASKSTGSAISAAVISLKEEIEKLRELVQNVE